MLKFLWYVVMMLFYVCLSAFVLYSLIFGMGTLLCTKFPDISRAGVINIGMMAVGASALFFIGGSYLHCHIKEKHFNKKEGETCDDVDN